MILISDVHILIRNEDYEGGSIMEVFDSYEKAYSFLSGRYHIVDSLDKVVDRNIKYVIKEEEDGLICYRDVWFYEGEWKTSCTYYSIEKYTVS